MAKVTFSSLKLKTPSEVKNITIGDKTIEVKQYLPASEKDSLLALTIQNCSQGTVIDTFAIDCLFHTYLVMEYTNISFTDKQKEDLFALYDLLNVNGIIDAVVEAMPDNEYTELHDNLDDMIDAYAIYRNSARGFVEAFSAFAPAQAESIAKIVEGLDQETLNKLGKIMQIAE